MYYSNNLVKQFISIQDDPKQIGKNLTYRSCEIEKIIDRKMPDLVIIGYVTEVKKHSNADKLFVCQIDCGTNGKYQICTGGENIVENSFVPVAIPGCYLSAIDLQIEPRKMRGEESNGMICSKEELGIQEDTEKHRIRTLGNDFQDLSKTDIGKKLSDKYPRLDNTLREVDNKNITHRPDLTGHFGLSNELFAIYCLLDNTKIKFQKVKELREYFDSPNTLNILQNAKQSNKKIIKETEKLRSYLLIELNNIKVRSSSFFLRLQAIDLEHTPRNNRVDFSNIFMDLTGNPIHFFDADLVKGNITVRQAIDGELFEDLLGGKHMMTCDDIVITDEDGILAIAGIIGGQRSAISDQTKNIIVEIANFDPISVRKTSKRLGVRTDAVMRFEKDINPIYSIYLINIFLDSLKLYSNDLGKFEIGGLDYFIKNEIEGQIYKKNSIGLDFKFVSKLMFGKDKPELESVYKKILESLGFKVENTAE